jgi:hypothetical protein
MQNQLLLYSECADWFSTDFLVAARFINRSAWFFGAAVNRAPACGCSAACHALAVGRLKRFFNAFLTAVQDIL